MPAAFCTEPIRHRYLVALHKRNVNEAMSARPACRRTEDDGFILVVVIGLLLIASIIAATLMLASRSQIKVQAALNARAELESLFDDIVFVGSDRDREVASNTYPGWKAFDDGGDFLRLANLLASSRAMIGCGSAPIALAGAMKIPAIRVHDAVGNNAPKVIWDNLGENQLNDTEVGLRKSWPVWRDKCLLVTAS